MNNLNVWLARSLREVSTTVNPRSWVEQVALTAPRIVYEGGLGNPLRSSNPVAAKVRSAFARIPRGSHYGREGGMPQTIEAARWFSETIDGVKLSEKEVLVSEIGSCPFLGYLAEAMLDEMEFLDADCNLQVLIAAPAYGRHVSVLPKRDVKTHLVDFYGKVNEGVSFAQALEEALLKYKVKLVVLSSVYNPTTLVMTETEMRSAVMLCKKYGAVLFMDDAYRHVYRESRGPIPSVLSLLNLPEFAGALVCATLSASKGLQSPGKGGLLLGDSRLIKMAAKVRNRKGEGGDVQTQLAFAAMLLDVRYLEVTRRLYDQHMSYLVEAWSGAGWSELSVSDASIFIQARIPEVIIDAGWNANNFARELARRGVIVYPASFFPGATGEWVRICMTGNRSSIDQGGQIIHEMLNNLPSLETWPQDE